MPSARRSLVIVISRKRLDGEFHGVDLPPFTREVAIELFGLILGPAAVAEESEAVDELIDLADRHDHFVRHEAVGELGDADQRSGDVRVHVGCTEFRDRLIEIAASPEKTRAYLLATSMISSLKRAEELG